MNEKKYVKIRRNARRRRWRRNRGKIIALAVILVLVLAGGGALWHFQGDRLLSAFSGRGAENREDSAQSEGGTEESGETEKEPVFSLWKGHRPKRFEPFRVSCT